MLPQKSVLLFLFWSISVGLFAQDSIATVVAQPGDGILSLLRKQGYAPREYYRDFVKLNMESLKDSMHLIAGRRYVLPPKKENQITTTSTQPETKIGNSLFGETYAAYSIKSKALENCVYYLVSGHGGPDPGAITSLGGQTISEDEYAYDITLRLARELMSHSAEVFIIVQDPNDGIRDERVLPIDRDEVVYPNKTIPLDQLQRLQQRVDAVNQLYKKNRGKYQRLLVTHIDSRSKGQNIDVFFYHHKKSKGGKRLAESIHNTFEKKYGIFQPNREYTGTFSDRSTLYMVKKTHPPMVYIEIGNIKNPKDQRRILVPDNRQALAKWISEGVMLDRQRSK